MTEQQFQQGDHLMVRRPGYDHHGIYVDDDRVIDFGGYNLLHKHRNGVHSVTLQQFSGGRKVEVIHHPTPGRIFGTKWLPSPLPRDQIIAEAERLAKIGFVGKYTLFGSNCEHVANYCVTGNYFESLQTKRLFAPLGALLLIMILIHKSKQQTTWWRVTTWAILGITAIAGYQRERAPYKFWKGINRRPSPPFQ